MLLQFILVAVLFVLCYFKVNVTKPAKSMELNEEQFFENIERAKRGDGDESDINKNNFVLSNADDFNEGVPRKV